ncbi:MAG TPA: glycosyltransferase family 39 protein [Bryobacteraceae bacterium]
MDRILQARIPWVCLVIFAGLLWTRHIDRPIDLPAWHEFDYASIARNFVTEGNHILYPRIDWRRDGPGFTEMEFPIHPWITAQIYRISGINVMDGRLISSFASLLSLIVFSRLALYLLPEGAAWTAALFFVISRETLYVSSAFQPEALMLMFYLLAAYFFLRWHESGGWWNYITAILSYSSAILVKSPAAHLGFFFLFLALKKDSIRAFRRPALWLFAAASLLPAALWYAHAHSLWNIYHNSMGVSNEDHWMGLDTFRNPKPFLMLIGIEAVFVFAIGGVVVALLGVVRNKQSRAVQVSLLWAAAVAIYYLAIIRTAGAYWASYYHIVAVPAAALLFGVGIQYLRENSRGTGTIVLGGAMASIPLVIGLHAVSRRGWLRSQGLIEDSLAAHLSWFALILLSAASLLLIILILKVRESKKPARDPASLSRAALLGAGAALAIYLMVSGQLTLSMWTLYNTRTQDFEATARFAHKIAPGALIVSSGGPCQDAAGHRVAGDAPEMFYWLDRKGFSLCLERQSIGELQSFERRGARYFVAEKSSVRYRPNLEEALKQTFPLLAECPTAWLFELQPKP